MARKKPFISYCTDFGPGNRGNGVMVGIALAICPNAQIVELCTSIPAFDINSGAQSLEGVKWLPIGCHVCVVDPGVGTKRKGLVIQTKRGDFLIGPDNGVLIPASEFLGGIEKVHVLENQKLMNQPVSNVFHGRDIFMPCAAHLSNRAKIQEFGKEIKKEELVKAPYENAKFDGKKIECKVIHVNQEFNVFVNVLQEDFHKLAKLGDKILMQAINQEIILDYVKTFGEVKIGQPLILDSDFGRIEIALNQGFFAQKFGIKIGQKIVLQAKK